MTLAIALLLTGVIWTIQLVHYPSFRFIPEEDFRGFHRRHTLSVSVIVIPLMLAELALTFIAFPGILPATCTAIAWLSTFLVQVPIHRKLEKGKDDRAIERLILTNWVRTAAWTAKATLLVL